MEVYLLKVFSTEYGMMSAKNQIFFDEFCCLYDVVIMEVPAQDQLYVKMKVKITVKRDTSSVRRQK